MPKFVIERDIENIGNSSPEELRSISKKARDSMTDSAAGVQWLYSFVTDDKTYCVYIAPDEEALRQRSDRAGFPTTKICKVTSIIDAATAD